eukprot:CAMPEP_0170447812 /NCGR_PEP_ID=MMETSP0117_2-20130122/50372_1 /TAXON_ID=400756 /ORGANISM="Durinskia baltica, Strain CSIRO CS-38" /LENGTH=109 /DNA_ID=CAMNT_0010708935 /DNA_START=66 /DNA_END=395 /DNA_ORIENTATION=-
MPPSAHGARAARAADAGTPAGGLTHGRGGRPAQILIRAAPERLAARVVQVCRGVFRAGACGRLGSQGARFSMRRWSAPPRRGQSGGPFGGRPRRGLKLGSAARTLDASA